MKKFSIIILPVILSAVISVCGIVYTIQDSMVFRNVSDPQSRQFLQGRTGYSEITFTAGNGKTYNGMMYQAIDGKAPLVIYFGGNGEVSHIRLRNLEENTQWKYYAGYHFIYMDYEGYGLNGGRTSQKSMYEESLAVFDYAASLAIVDPGCIVSMGYSIGTGSAVYLAANRPVAALILAAPYSNGIDLYNNILPIFYGPMQLLVKHKLPSDKYALNVTCPVLVIASHKDEMVPFASTKRLSGLFSGPVEFIELENERHNGLFRAEGVYDKIKVFLEKAAFSGGVKNISN